MVRWLVLAVTTVIAVAALWWTIRAGVVPEWWARLLVVGAGLVLFVASLIILAGLPMVLHHAVARRRLVEFEVEPGRIVLHSKARRSAPRVMYRDEVAGPFVRIDEAIDEEASATTMMRMGGDDAATMLAEGARSTGGSADTATWFLFADTAASVTVIWRGFTVVLAEALTRAEAEALAHEVALRLERLPG